METGKCSDLDDKEKQGKFINSKDLVPDIKAKVDFNDIIDVSLQGQDYTNGLNAEVDLDESIDKTEINLDNDNNDNKIDNNANNERNDKELMIGIKENTDKVSEKIDLESCKESIDTDEKIDPAEENIADNSSLDSGNKSDDKEILETDAIEIDMGNNLEVKEELETNVDGHCDKNVIDLNQPEGGESENNNVNKTEATEPCNQMQHDEHSEVNDVNSVQESTNDTKTDTVSEENHSNGIGADDESFEAKLEPKEENLDNENSMCKDSKEMDKENQISENDPNRKDNAEDKESTVCEEMKSVEANREVGDIDDGIIDREKVQNFIKEVINDMQGIVIEADECDSVFKEMCDEDAKCELVIDVEVNDVKVEKADTKTSESKVGEATEDETTEKEVSEEIADAYKNPVLNGEIMPSEENLASDKYPNPVTQTEETPKINDNTTEDQITSEFGTDNTGDMPNAHELNSEHKNKEKDMPIEEGVLTAAETQIEQPVRSRNKNDITMVEEELKTTQTALRQSQRCLQDERSKHNRDVISLKLQLCRCQTELKHQKSKSEKQLSEIMSHLVMLESRLRKEQLKLQRETKEKNCLIGDQKKEILKLKDQNEQLMNAIKEICANGGMNGYMRRKNGSNGESFESSAKGTRDKKGPAGKLVSMKDKFSSKNRSSLELSTLNLEKYLIKNERLYSSQEELHKLGDERRRSIPSGDERIGRNQSHDTSPKDRPVSDNSEYKNGRSKKNVRNSYQNFFSDSGSPKYEMNNSVSDSSQLSESSGFHSLSDHDLSTQIESLTNGNQGNHDFIDDDEDDDRIFSFSSTHINTVIDEEEPMGPVMSHSGQMMSMGSMPMLANLKKEQLISGKNRPHSLSSVDLMSIQQQAQNSPRMEQRVSPKGSPVSEEGTPPSSPSYIQAKNELTPFQTFKTMFKRKGSSKSKGHKKRSVSLSQTTNMEYSEALKKHFQKYDMS